MRTLRSILGLCLHKWEVIDSYRHMKSYWRVSNPEKTVRAMQIGTAYTLKCTVCGDIKRRKGA